MKKKKKFNTGGMVSGGSNDPLQNILLQQYSNLMQNPTHIENPNTTLTRNNIATAKAMQEAESNPWTQGLDLLGSMAMSYGMNMMGSGATGTTPSGGEASTTGGTGWLNGLFGASTDKKAFGGRTGKSNVEVEGEEVGQLPDGTLLDFIGPKHEQGGIDVNLPDGTAIFSDRIKIDGKTMAERKKAREKQTNKLSKLSKENSSDALLKNTIKRTKEVSDKEDMFDMSLQQMISNEENGKFNNGGVIGDFLAPFLQNLTGNLFQNLSNNPTNYSYPLDNTSVLDELVIDVNQPKGIAPLEMTPQRGELTPSNPIGYDSLASDTSKTKSGDGFNLNSAGLPTFGDAMGIYGNLKQARDLKNLTLENRAGDTPNINAFENFGKDALNTLQGSKNYVAGARDANIRDLNTARAGSVGRNRNSARGINTLRALDLATDSQVNQSLNDLYSTFANQMLGILGQESQMEMQQDQVVMGGEQARDLADRQDRDAFYNNLSRNQQAIGESISRTGKNVNQIKERGTNQNFLNMLSDYFDIDVANGTMKPKKNLSLAGEPLRDFESFTKDKGYSDDYTKKEWDALSKEEQEKYYISKKLGR